MAGFALLVLLALRKKPLLPRRALLWWSVPVGLMATTLTFGSMFLSASYLSTGIATVLGNLQPLIIIILAAVFLGESITRRKLCAATLGLAGLTLIAIPMGSSQQTHSMHGLLLALSTSVGAAGASILIKKLQPGPDLIALTAWQLIVGSLPLLGWSLVMEAGDISWNPVFISLLLLLALGGTALTTVLWFWLLQDSDAGSLSLSLFLIPLLGLLIGFLFYGETLSGMTIGGVLLILLALGFPLFANTARRLMIE